MNIFQIHDICKDKLGVIEYLQQQNVLHAMVQCAPCEQTCTLIKESSKLSGYLWRCKKCKRKQSVLKDSFLESAGISPAKFVYIVFYWATRIPLQATMKHIDISARTGVDYYRFLRDICSWKLLTTTIQLGGPGKEVQIDVSVQVNAVFRRDRNVEMWVFGAYDVGEKVGYVTYVSNRDAATLLPIIQKVVVPGSVVLSDDWAAYRDISNMPGNYQHRIVNRGQTNNAETYCRLANASFKRRSKDMVPGHLNEFMWRERFGSTFDLAYLNILRHISERYPC